MTDKKTISRSDRKVINQYGTYLDCGIGLSQHDHEIREQAYKVESEIETQEIEAKNFDHGLKEFDILEILYALAKWGNKQEPYKRYWEKQISLS